MKQGMILRFPDYRDRKKNPLDLVMNNKIISINYNKITERYYNNYYFPITYESNRELITDIFVVDF